MEHARMLVLSIDAMTGDDLRAAAALSNFARLLDGCALATEVLSVFPSLTYPCHVAMATGCWPMHTGVYNNERFLPETRKRHGISIRTSWPGPPSSPPRARRACARAA